jgi:hypothetical protein
MHSAETGAPAPCPAPEHFDHHQCMLVTKKLHCRSIYLPQILQYRFGRRDGNTIGTFIVHFKSHYLTRIISAMTQFSSRSSRIALSFGLVAKIENKAFKDDRRHLLNKSADYQCAGD